MTGQPMRWAWAEVHLDAIEDNLRVLRDIAAPASVWAVVKANAYGHGAVDVARAALDAGAEGLCVALVAEGIELRRAGIDAPILVLSQQPVDQLDEMVVQRLSATAYDAAWIAALAEAAHARRQVAEVHLKLDTGMQRVGSQPAQLPQVLSALRDTATAIRIGGVYTHLAVADDPADPTTTEQLERFDEMLAVVADTVGLERLAGTLVHAANSAATLAHPRARRSLTRIGIAMYGISPGPGVDALCSGLRPAMSLHARVAHVKRVAAGSRISYGLRHAFERETTVATIPLGYADGVPRRLASTGGAVLIGGLRRPIVGVITMDQLMVDVGDDPVAVGDPVVLIGRQGDAQIRAEEWAERLDTIGYEIVCGIGSRVPRVPGRSISS